MCSFNLYNGTPEHPALCHIYQIQYVYGNDIGVQFPSKTLKSMILNQILYQYQKHNTLYKH